MASVFFEDFLKERFASAEETWNACPRPSNTPTRDDGCAHRRRPEAAAAAVIIQGLASSVDMICISRCVDGGTIASNF